jgi:hypothetical protein
MICVTKTLRYIVNFSTWKVAAKANDSVLGTANTGMLVSALALNPLARSSRTWRAFFIRALFRGKEKHEPD